MKRKYAIALLLTVIIISFSVLPSVATLEESLTSEQTTYNNNLNKLHFYFDDVGLLEENINTLKLQSAENKYSYIDDKTELDNAIKNMNQHLEKSNITDTPITITVEFKSGFTDTSEYKMFCEEKEELKTIEEVRDFRKRLNNFSNKYHREEYEKNIKNLSSFDFEDIKHIEYSPFVVMSIKKENIVSKSLVDLSEKNSVLNISLNLEEKFENEVLWSNALKDIKADDIVSNKTYTGEGVRVGIYENALCEKTHLNLYKIKDQITTDDRCNNENADKGDIRHANRVTSVIALMAPDASFFVSSYNDYGVAWFINNLCDVVNVSLGSHTNGYDFTKDGVFDYQIRTHFITVVTSAGNVNVDTQNSFITSPGFAHNVITVGGVDRGGTLLNNYLEYDSSACYTSIRPLIKPEISAICELTIPNVLETLRGTSYAAPQVTGAIALLLDKYPDISTNVGAIKALLMASANKTEGYQEDIGYFDDRVGAGSLDVDELLNIEGMGYQIVNPSMNLSNCIIGNYTIDMEQGESLQAALSWYATIASVENEERYVTNYDLRLYNDNNVLVCESNHGDVNTVEFIRYVAPATGQYTLSIYLNGSMNENNTFDHVYYAYYTN